MSRVVGRSGARRDDSIVAAEDVTENLGVVSGFGEVGVEMEPILTSIVVDEKLGGFK